MPKRILITGGSGFIGSHIVRRAVNDGHTVFLLLRKNASLERIADIAPNRYRVVIADVTDYVAVEKAIQEIQPEWIFHMANAGVYGGVSQSDEVLTQVNVIGLMHLLKALDPIPYEAFINGASSAEYGPKSTPMKETDLCEPLSTYAITKLASTTYASMIGRLQKKPILSFRIFSPYGPHDEEKRFIPVAVRALMTGATLSVDPQAVRDYVYVTDLIDLFFLGASQVSRSELQGQIFNAGSGIERSAHAVALEIAQRLGKKTDTIISTATHRRPWDSTHWQADMTKVEQLLGWKAKTDFTEGLTQTISWIQNS